jgi:hypothetical protein
VYVTRSCPFVCGKQVFICGCKHGSKLVASTIDAIVMKTLSVDINTKVSVRHIERMLPEKLGLIYWVVLQVIEVLFLT